MHDEPLEDSVDWAALRRISAKRREDEPGFTWRNGELRLRSSIRPDQLEDERRRGIPPMEENQKQVVRDMAVEAWRGR